MWVIESPGIVEFFEDLWDSLKLIVQQRCELVERGIGTSPPDCADSYVNDGLFLDKEPVQTISKVTRYNVYLFGEYEAGINFKEDGHGVSNDQRFL